MSEQNLYPNTFQVHNFYIDQILHLLTGEEWKVLSYAIRKIIGFQKSCDSISLSQFVTGCITREGKRLDHGTGLCRESVCNILKSLLNFGLLILVSPNDPKENEGNYYGLQFDTNNIRFDLLEERLHAKKTASRTRTEKARQAAIEQKRRAQTQESATQTKQQQDNPGMSQRPRAVSQDDQSQSNEQTDLGMSDRHTKPSLNPDLNQDLKAEEKESVVPQEHGQVPSNAPVANTAHTPYSSSKEERTVTPNTSSNEKTNNNKPPSKQASKPEASPVIKSLKEFNLTQSMRQWAKEKAPVLNVDIETERFLLCFKSSSKSFPNWLDRWQKWILDEYKLYLENKQKQEAREQDNPLITDHKKSREIINKGLREIEAARKEALAL
jgi:hypothetical protein